MLKIKSIYYRAVIGAIMMSAITGFGTGVSWGSTAHNLPSGINETGVNVWTITSTPMTASIKFDDKAYNALPPSIRNAGVLRIGAITDEPPFIFIKNGKLQGVDVDMMGGLAKSLGIKIKLYKTSFEGMIPGLQAGRFDVIMGDLTDTKEREKVIDFVDYLKNYQTVLIRKGERRDFSTLMSLCGHTAAAAKGGLSVTTMMELSAICVKNGLHPVNMKTYPGDAQSLLALDTGRIDMIPVTYAVAVYLEKQNSEKYRVTDNLFYQSYKGAGLLKNRPDLLKALVQGFQTVIESSDYNSILSYWGLQKVKVSKVYLNSPGKPLSETQH